MKEFEIWVADIATFIGDRMKAGVRPVIIVDAEADKVEDKMVTVVPCTTNLRFPQRPTHVLLQGQGLEEDSRVLCERIMTVDKRILQYRIGEVWRPYDRYAIRHALAVHMGLHMGLQEDGVWT